MATTSPLDSHDVPDRRASRTAVVAAAVVLGALVVGGAVALGALIELVTKMFTPS
jgi:hypothetical protein